MCSSVPDIFIKDVLHHVKPLPCDWYTTGWKLRLGLTVIVGLNNHSINNIKTCVVEKHVKQKCVSDCFPQRLPVLNYINYYPRDCCDPMWRIGEFLDRTSRGPGFNSPMGPDFFTISIQCAFVSQCFIINLKIYLFHFSYLFPEIWIVNISKLTKINTLFHFFPKYHPIRFCMFLTLRALPIFHYQFPEIWIVNITKLTKIKKLFHFFFKYHPIWFLYVSHLSTLPSSASFCQSTSQMSNWNELPLPDSHIESSNFLLQCIYLLIYLCSLTLHLLRIFNSW